MTAAMNQRVTPTDLIAALDVLRVEFRTRAVWCDTCQRRHIRGEQPGPFVDVTPAAIPPDDLYARDLVADLIDRMSAHRLGDGRMRILLPTASHAITTAALLRSLGAPKHAVFIGGC